MSPTILAHATTGVVCLVILVLYAVYRKSPLATTALPNLLTVLGILGTFAGILIGLLFFNTGDIQGSVPDLLAGMKTAFITSVVGIFFALLLRVENIVRRSRMPTGTEGATLETIAGLLSEIKAKQDAMPAHLDQRLHRIEESLVGDGDTTLLTQLKLLRLETSEKQGELVRAFREFQADMAKHHTDALIKALNDVIRDFNLKLTEQFGENFKQLNQAVEKLVTWQENYKEALSTIEQQFERCLAGIQSSEKALMGLTAQADSLVRASGRLESMLLELETLRGDLHEHLEQLAAVSEKAQALVPNLQKAIDDMTNSLSQASMAVLRTAEMSREALERQAKQLQESTGKVQASIQRTTESASEEVRRMVARSNAAMQKQLGDLDKAMGDELHKAIESLAKHLVQMSAKLVEDYSPLLEKLRELVQIAETARHYRAGSGN